MSSAGFFDSRGNEQVSTGVAEKIRKVLTDHARTQVPVSDLSDDDDLYQAGLTSHASVNVMLALEDAFDVEFPDVLLRRSTFQSVSSIRQALSTLGVLNTAA
jgi:acyl carrier protein